LYLSLRDSMDARSDAIRWDAFSKVSCPPWRRLCKALFSSSACLIAACCRSCMRPGVTAIEACAVPSGTKPGLLLPDKHKTFEVAAMRLAHRNRCLQVQLWNLMLSCEIANVLHARALASRVALAGVS